VPTSRRPRADVSNTQTKTNAHFSFEKARAEAKGEPFVIDVNPETQITIARPTADQIFEVEEAMRRSDSRGILRAFCGDTADQFLALVGPEDAGVLKAVSEAMQKHFGLGE